MESFLGIYEKYSVIAYDLEGNKIFLRYEKWKCDVNWIFKYYAKRRKKDLYGKTTFSMVSSIECYEDEIQGLLGKRYLFISDDTFIDMTTNLPLPGETRKQFLEENLIEGE